MFVPGSKAFAVMLTIVFSFVSLSFCSVKSRRMSELRLYQKRIEILKKQVEEKNQAETKNLVALKNTGT